MATTVDTLLVRIESDMSGIRRDLKRLETQTGQTSKKVQGSMSKMGTAIKGALGVAAVAIIGRFIAQNIKLASSVEEMQSKSSVVFGQFVDGVRKDLEQFGDAVGRSTHELEGMASSVQDTFVPLGFARGDAADLSVALTKLAVDVASFNNASDTETMQAFQSALVGNHEAVRRFGIVITEAELKAELFRMGITKNAADVDAATKVQARLNLIMAGTSDAQGDAERTSDSFANRSKALSAALEELMVNVMTPLLPILADFVGGVTSAVNAVNEFLTASGLLTQDLTNQGVVVELLNKKMAELAEAEERASKSKGRNAKGAKDQVKALKAEIVELEKAFDANAKKAASLQKSTAVTKTATTVSKEQQDADKKATDMITGLANQNEILTMKLQGRTEAEIALKEAQHSFGGNKEDKAAFDANEARIKKEIQQQLAKEKALTKITKGQQMAAQAAQEFRTEEDMLQERINAVGAAMRGSSQEDMVLYQGALDGLNQEMKRLNPMFAATEQAAMKAGDAVADVLAEAVVKGKLDADALKSIFANLIQELIAEAIKTFIIRKIMSAVFGGLAGGGSVNSGGFTDGGQFSGLAGGGKIPARAGGGPVLVGERGPELFVPHSSGVIRNNHDTKNMMGGGSPVVVNQNINIETGVAQTVRAEVMSMMPRIKSETVQAMIDGKRRGNSISKAFA